MERKTFRGRLELKADKPGEFTAVIATLNVKDHDGDVTLPGAFTDGEEVRIAQWGHSWDALPAGRGVVHEEGEEAVVAGSFFMDTQAGKEHYATVKALGPLQEWSYGYEILESEPGKVDADEVRFLKKLRVIEVSPVMQGAGINTRTTAIKTGARHSVKDVEMLQQIHDLAVQLGAKCRGQDDSADEGEGDEAKKHRQTLAQKVADELLAAGAFLEEVP